MTMEERGVRKSARREMSFLIPNVRELTVARSNFCLRDIPELCGADSDFLHSL